MKEKKIFYGWWIVVACTLIMATYFTLLLSCISLFVVPVTEGLGISRSAFGTFSTIRSGVGLILSPIVGKLCAKKNLRYIMSGGLLVGVLGYTAISYVNSLPMLYLLAIVNGFGLTFASSIPTAVIMTRWFVEKRGTALSITFAGSSIGAMLLSPIITDIITAWGWRMAFRSLGLGMLVTLVPLVFLIIRNAPEDKGLVALGADKAQKTASREMAAAARGLPLKVLKGKPIFWVFIVAIFVMQLTMGAMYHMAAHVTGVLNDAAAAARFVSAFSFFGIIGKLSMGAVFDKWGEKAGMWMGIFCMSMCFVFLLISKSFAMFMVVAVFYGLGSAHSTIFPPQLTSRIFGTKHYSEIYGLINAVVSLSMGVNNLIMAAAYDTTGSYKLAWIFGLASAIIGGSLLFVSVNRGKKLDDGIEAA